MEKLETIISEYPKIALVLIIFLATVVLVTAIVSSSRRKKILSFIPNKPGEILEVKEGTDYFDYIVVNPTASLINCTTGQACKVYEILDKIWDNVGKELAKFYKDTFEIKMKIADLQRTSNGYFIIVSDRDENLYELRTKYLPPHYIVNIQQKENAKTHSEEE